MGKIKKPSLQLIKIVWKKETKQRHRKYIEQKYFPNIKKEMNNNMQD